MKKAEIKTLQEKAASYGIIALTDNELINMIGWNGPTEEFWNSPLFRAMKEAVRRKEAPELKKITTSKDAFEQLSFLEGLDHEEFWCIYTNRANRVIKTEFISKGGIAGTVVDLRMVLSSAIQLKCSGLVLCHNHPSGNLRPSEADVNLTKNVKEAVKLLGITLLDHIIIGDGRFFSFADDGMI